MVLFFSVMLLTTTAKKKLLLGNRIYSRGIAGFADQQIAFTRAQGGILQSREFN